MLCDTSTMKKHDRALPLLQVLAEVRTYEKRYQEAEAVYREMLKPGQAPEATFNITAGQVTVREHCNLHGQWSAQG